MIGKSSPSMEDKHMKPASSHRQMAHRQMGLAGCLDLRACWVLCHRFACAISWETSDAALCRDQPFSRAKPYRQLFGIYHNLYRSCCLFLANCQLAYTGRRRAYWLAAIGLIVVAATAGASFYLSRHAACCETFCAPAPGRFLPSLNPDLPKMPLPICCFCD